MNLSAPRSIDQYLRQLRAELAGSDPALIQDALYDAEEYLRAEVAATRKSESDVLELIASTYGAPDEVAAAYRDTEVKVKAAMATPRNRSTTKLGAFFGVFLDPRAYTSLFFMLLSLATGMIYFLFAVTGLCLSAGFAVLIIGVPFFLVFVAVSRVVSLAEGRLIEAMTGERMPRRPVYQGSENGLLGRIADMLKDRRTWTTIAYLLLMLPLGLVYFVIALLGLSVGLSFVIVPFAGVLGRAGAFGDGGMAVFSHVQPEWLGSAALALPMLAVGILLLTTLMHVARGMGRMHAVFAKHLLVARSAPDVRAAVDSAAPLAAH